MGTNASEKSGAGRAIMIAWLVTAVYYFYQYTLRSSPSVMIPQLTEGLASARRRSPPCSGSSTTAILLSA